ncbi:MAG TPA: hypothetical protein VMR62_25050, partial [Bryobacteraceae bacterium]|nr:hypothetical protein [Bryobacteraceae bacterium]
GETRLIRAQVRRSFVSIHAARAGRDQGVGVLPGEFGVSIHAARAGRDLAVVALDTARNQFQSTRPARAATSCP